MDQQESTVQSPGNSLMNDALEYVDDTWQKSILFMDILRKRGNIYHEHMAAGNPPVLTFDYKIVIDGRDLEKPVNFSLARIIDRRKQPVFNNGPKNRRGIQVESPTRISRSKMRPIVIVDPRAGHGPGIGGSKRDSEIGIALVQGHPVYFILFGPDPVRGQTLLDVHNAQIGFLEEIRRLHPEAEKPAIIGNCQGGWASALIAADRPDLTGPLVFNGSPLSYWAGEEGKNPMRYKGGLLGGTWMVSLWGDLGGGKFDGANLVAGFEDLNPANTLWNKQYNVFSTVDTEEERYLAFERWWNGYYFMTEEEISFIINNLFVGNRLEQGLLEMNEDTRIDLKNLRDPVLVFASSGDNITPPQQALNWIVKVWGDVENLKRCGQTVVYLVHETIGHLGIFVSGAVSRKEHKQIIGSIDLMGYLAPGLYEMVIVEGENFKETGEYEYSFEEREMEDILSLDDGLEDEEDFRLVSAVSEFNDQFYKAYVSPFIQFWWNDVSADWLRQYHYLRWSRYLFADLNPWMLPFRDLAENVKENRRKSSEDNFFVQMEKETSNIFTTFLNSYRDIRDAAQEFTFQAMYANPFLPLFFGGRIDELGQKEEALKKQAKTRYKSYEKTMYEAMEEGGFVEGVSRIFALLLSESSATVPEELKFIRKLVNIHNSMTHTTEEELKKQRHKQMLLLQFDKEKAIEALPKLIRGAENRLAAIQMAEALVETESVAVKDENRTLERIKALLDDKKTL